MLDERGLRRLAWWLDAAFRIPGTQQRIGVDALIGLVPGIGDTVGALLSTYIIVAAARGGASVWTVARMLGNVAVETTLGAVPIVGDLFDAAFKANLRNVALLADTLGRGAPPRDPTAVLRLATILIAVTITAIVIASSAITIVLVRALLR